MRRSESRSLVVPLVLTALLLPVLAALLQGSTLPCTHDNIFHSYRIVAMREMLRFGWLFSRWVPNLALGFGYPFFNYREPLPYWVGEAAFASGLPLPLVLGGLYVVSLVAAGWGAYVLGRDLFGERAGWVASVGYALAPYLMLDVLRRGNMPEAVGLALVPWLFVVTRRLILTKSRRSFVATMLLLVALFLSHNISGLLLAPLLGVYVVLLAWQHRDRKAWPWVFLAVGIAVLLTAWFWLPALTEQGMVQLHLSRSTRNNDYHYNFVTLREMLLIPPTPHDPAYLNPPMRINLGVVQVGLGLAGAVLGLWRRSESRWLVGLLVVAASVTLWLATPGSVGLWDAIPLMAFVQFPWRLVGRALLPVCLLAGLGVETAAGWLAQGSLPPSLAKHKRWLSTALVIVAIAALAVVAWPTMIPPKGICPAQPYPGLQDLYAREQEGWIGMDPESSYFPIWVEEHPTALALADAFVAGTLPERLDPASLPAGTSVIEADYRPLRAALVVDAPVSYEARWLGLYYPGWQVLIDGERVAVAPQNDTGLMIFDVPAGEHEIRVRFGTTPARAVGNGLTAAGLLAAAAVWTIPGLRLSPPSPAARILHLREDRTSLGRAVLALAAGLLLVRIAVVDRLATPVQRTRVAGDHLPEVQFPLGKRFEDGMTLLGYTIGAETVSSDGELQVDLLWQASETPATDLRTTVLLRSPDGQVWSPAGTARPRGYEPMPPTNGWAPGNYAYDGHIVIPFAGTPPGEYQIVVAIFDRESLTPLSPLDADGRATGPDLVLGSVRLDPPVAPLTPEAAGVAPDVAAVPCGPLALLEVTLDREAGVPGDVLAVRWVWKALETPGSDVQAALTLVKPEGSEAREWSLAPSAAWWPTDRWTEGELWVGRHVVRLPGDLDSGVYAVQVRAAGCDELLASVPLAVTAPARTWTMHEGLTAVEVAFGDEIALVGHSPMPPTPVPGDAIDIRLAWEARAPMETAYRVYLHALDTDGAVIAQSDGDPADWTRPTTGWAVGEIISDLRRLDIPETASGTVTLRVGLYVPGGSRLLTADGDDGVTLATLDLR